MLLKLITAIILVPTLSVGGMTAYLWYDTKQRVDELVAKVLPFRYLGYNSITVSPLGSVSINDIRLSPHGAPDQVSIGTLRFSAPNVFALLDLNKQRLPETLTVAIDRLRLPLTGSLGDKMATLPKPPKGIQAIEALACGDLPLFNVNEYIEMGYTDIVGNFRISYELDNKVGTLDLKLNSSIDDMFSSQAQLSLNSAFFTTVTEIPQSHLRLVSGELSIDDLGYNANRNTLCTTRTHVDVATYLDNHVHLLVEQLTTNGIVPSAEVIDAYRQTLKPDSQLDFTFEPLQPIGLADLNQFQPDQLDTALGLTVQVNQKPINDLAAAFTLTGTAPSVATHSDNENAVATKVAARPLSVTERRAQAEAKHYRPIELAELGGHFGKPGIVTLKSGRRHKGLLTGMRDGALQLQLWITGGNATYSIQLAHIESLLVRR